MFTCCRARRWVALCALAGAATASAETAVLQGSVRNATSGEPLPSASIVLTAAGYRSGTASAYGGRYRFEELAPATYALKVSYVGFVETVIDGIELRAGESRDLDVGLEPATIQLNPVTVSVSRRTERAIESPAAISVLDEHDITSRSAPTLVEHLKGVSSVDVAMTGITGSRIVVRGVNNSFSGRLLTLTDYRIANLPALRVNSSSTIPTSQGDVDRIEVLKGPGSAFYGPNAAGGVLHYITKSPLQAPQTTLSLGIGERAQRTGEVRHSAHWGEHVGYKLSVSVFQAHDWESIDPNEPAQITRTLQSPHGAILLGQPRANARDFDASKIAGDVRVDVELSDEATAILAAGTSIVDELAITGIGYYQVDDWQTSYLQARLLAGDLFAQAFLNRSDAGDTFNLRTGELVIDKGQQFVTQVQHGTTLFGGRHRLTYGADLLLTRPDSEGTVYGRNENDDHINEIGAYLQSEFDLSARWKLLATGRVDQNNRLQDLVFSPRAAVVYRAGESQTLRLTYNKAFETTPAINLFLDLNAFPFGAYTVRVIGVPTETGFTFARDAGGGVDGLYMHSPYTPAEEGGKEAAIPADATRRWDVVVAALGDALTDVPAPGPGEVQTVLRELNARAGFIDEDIAPESVRDIRPLRSLETTTWEAGYKGILNGNLSVTGNLYYERNRNFAVFNVITPNVFFDSTSVAAYLAESLPQAAADSLAGEIAALRLGTVSPLEGDPADLILSSREFGATSHLGLEIGFAWYPTPRWTLTGDVSLLSDNLFPRKSGWPDDISLNASDRKGALSAAWENDTFRGKLRWRYVGAFEIRDPLGADYIPTYSVFDLTAGSRLTSIDPSLRLDLSVDNLLDRRHKEFILSPRIGRLATLRLAYEL